MNRRKILYYLVVALLLAVFLGSAAYVGSYILDARSARERFDNLSALVEQHRQEPAPTAPPMEAPPAGEEAEMPMLPEYQALYELNSDTVGWIRIEGTPVDYPVMQTPESPDYYLRRNFDRQKDVRGCLYAREVCDVREPSDNITIYGHHMIDGSMFACLEKYERKTYWEEHPTLTFDTLWGYHSYRIFAAFRTSANAGEGFAYHEFVDAANAAEFDEFVATCRELSGYDTGIVPEYGDKLICLSTCEYTLSNGRFVVVAVRED